VAAGQPERIKKSRARKGPAFFLYLRVALGTATERVTILSSNDIVLAITAGHDNFKPVPRQIQNQSIVVVEDDPYIGGALDAFLGEKNIVQTFGSAEAALAATSHFRGVSVSSSITNSQQDGIGLFQELRAAFPAAKFILITGEMSSDMVERRAASVSMP